MEIWEILEITCQISAMKNLEKKRLEESVGMLRELRKVRCSERDVRLNNNKFMVDGNN